MNNIEVDWGNYESPVELIVGEQEKQFEKDVLKFISSYNINVDADELVKALQYDRNQYATGYKAGYEAAMNEAIDYRTLFDWYISSVGDEEPVWTEQHIDELFRDYILIPKNANMGGGGDADEAP